MQVSPGLNELPEDLRDRKRSRVRLAATVESGGQRLKANLLNLSTTGAQLDATIPPAVDAELTLSRGNLEARGRVMWVNEHRFGIAFDRPLDEAIVAEHAGALAPGGKVLPLR